MNEQKEEIKKYLKENVNQIFEVLMTDIVLSKPKNIIAFCKKWFIKQQQRIKLKNSNSDSESDDQYIELSEIKKKNKVRASKFRHAISAEVYGTFNKKQDFIPRFIKKSQQTKNRILIRLKESFLFKNLDDYETNIVIDAMEQKKYDVDQTVIAQGEDGDLLYVVDKGQLVCFKTFQQNLEPKLLKSYYPGEAFGQLALLYNAPRGATIKVKKSAILFALDRHTFNNVVKEAAIKKRQIYDSTLQKVQILKQMDPYQRSQLADVLKQLNIHANEYVIKEGETGDKFYIVCKGNLAAYKNIVMNYKESDYFGQLALLNDIPRQASVLALTSCKLVYIQRDAFKRVFGPLQKILQRNAILYNKYKNKKLN